MYYLTAPPHMNSGEGVTNRTVFVFQCASKKSIVVDEIEVSPSADAASSTSTYFHERELRFHSLEPFVLLLGKGWIASACIAVAAGRQDGGTNWSTLDDLGPELTRRWRSSASQLLLINAISSARRLLDEVEPDDGRGGEDQKRSVSGALPDSPSCHRTNSTMSSSTTGAISSLASLRTAGCESCSRMMSIVAPECVLRHLDLLLDNGDGGRPAVIGQGASCRVHVGMTVAAPQPSAATVRSPLVAVKVITVPPASAHGRFAKICNEIVLMEELRLSPHPNLTALVGLAPPSLITATIHQPRRGSSFSNRVRSLSPAARSGGFLTPEKGDCTTGGGMLASCCHEIGIVMEYCDGGTLHELVQGIANKASRGCSPYSLSRRTLVERECMAIFYGIASGLQHLHTTLKILHRDVKPSNIFLCCSGDGERCGDKEHQQDSWRLKLGDLGVSSTGESARTSCGTKAYMAPEMCYAANVSPIPQQRHSRSSAKYDSRADVYSLGVTMQFVLSGGCTASLRKKWVVVMGNGDLPSDVWVVPSSVLCRRLWAGDTPTPLSEGRIVSVLRRGAGKSFSSLSPTTCLCDDIHADTIHLLNMMTHRDPLNRPGDLRDCMKHPAVLKHGARRPAQIKDLMDHVEGKSISIPIPSVSTPQQQQSAAANQRSSVGSRELASAVEALPARGTADQESTFDMWNPPSLRFLREVIPLCGTKSAAMLQSSTLGSASLLSHR